MGESGWPRHGGDLIGREGAMTAALALVHGGQRSFSLVGPPGIGKTHLAVELAKRLSERFSLSTAPRKWVSSRTILAPSLVHL
jgi:DNA replication protein DnaC